MSHTRGEFEEIFKSGVDYEKRPIGLMPRALYEEDVKSSNQRRVMDILAAMVRFTVADEPLPSIWIDELRDLAEGV